MQCASASILGVLAILAVAGCGPDSRTGDAGGQGARASDSAKAFAFEPGRYRSTVSIEKVELPGLPANAGEQMKAMMSKAASTEYCLTPAQSGRGVDLLKDNLAEGKCRFDTFVAKSGRVEATMTCQSGAGMTLQSTARGSYSTTGSVIRVNGELTGPDRRTMRVEQTITSERIGDCG